MRRMVRSIGAVASGILIAAGPLAAQTITTQQADEILQELRAIRQLLEKMTPPPPAEAPARAAAGNDGTVRLADLSGYMLGREDAPVTIVEFTDLQCPFCQRFANDTFDRLREEYIDTGRVRFITRDLPIPQLHPHAVRAARAARCAGEQGRFWEMHFALVKNADKLSPSFIAEQAQKVGLETLAFVDCSESGRFEAEIQADVDDAAAIGLTGTPSFVVGRTIPQGLEGTRIVGAQPFAVFDARIKALLLAPE